METVKTMERCHRLPFVLVTSMFLLWGLANNMTYILLEAFNRVAIGVYQRGDCFDGIGIVLSEVDMNKKKIHELFTLKFGYE